MSSKKVGSTSAIMAPLAVLFPYGLSRHASETSSNPPLPNAPVLFSLLDLRLLCLLFFFNLGEEIISIYTSLRVKAV